MANEAVKRDETEEPLGLTAGQQLAECEKEHQRAECEDLAAPAVVEIADTACGAATTEVSPSVLWQPVEASEGYLWEVVLADEGVADTGFSVAPEVEVGPLDVGTYVVRVQALGDGAVTLPIPAAWVRERKYWPPV